MPYWLLRCFGISQATFSVASSGVFGYSYNVDNTESWKIIDVADTWQSRITVGIGLLDFYLGVCVFRRKTICKEYQ